MDLPEKIEDLEQLSSFESLTRTVEDQIADALSNSIEDNTILASFADPTCARAFIHCLAVIGFSSVTCNR